MPETSTDQLITLEFVESILPNDRRVQALKSVYESTKDSLDNNHRVDSALQLILNGHISSDKILPNAKTGDKFLVRDHHNKGIYYTVTNFGCTCPDSRRNVQSKGWCKHRLARYMVMRTQKLLKQDRDNER